MSEKYKAIRAFLSAINIEFDDAQQNSKIYLDFDDHPTVICQQMERYLVFDSCVAVLPYDLRARDKLLEISLRRSAAEMITSPNVLYLDKNESSLRLRRLVKVEMHNSKSLVRKLESFLAQLHMWAQITSEFDPLRAPARSSQSDTSIFLRA